MSEPLTDQESPQQTVTVALDQRAAVVALAILAMVGAVVLGVWTSRRLSAQEPGPQPVIAPGPAPAQPLPQLQVPIVPSQRIQPRPPSIAGISVDVGTSDRASTGEPAPDFTLENLQGEPVTLSDLKGQPILINFWATWCPPCRFEMPALEAAYQKYQDQGFVVLAVDVQEPRGLVQSYINKLNLTIPVVLDQNGEVATEYRVRAYPTSIFVNREGEITQVHRGMLTTQAIERYLAEILPEG